MGSILVDNYGWSELITLFVMFFGYLIYNLCRKSVVFVLSDVKYDLEFSDENLGFMSSSLQAGYGVSKFCSGVATDYLNPKKLFSAGLILSGSSVIFLTIFNHSSAVYLTWCLHGVFQGLAWPCIAKFIKLWFPASALGTIWAFISCSVNLAGIVGPFAALLLTTIGTWRFFLCSVGLLAVAFGFLSLILLPSAVDAQNQKTSRRKKSSSGKSSSHNSETISTRLWSLLTTYPCLQLACVGFFVNGCIRQALLDWSQIYLIDTIGLPHLTGGTFLSSYELGGLIGTLAAGACGDVVLRICESQSWGIHPRFLVIHLSQVFLVSGLHFLAFYLTTDASLWVVSALGVVLGIGVYSAFTLYGVVACEASPPNVSGTSHAIAALSANIGATCAGSPLSHLAGSYGWRNVWFILELAVIASTTIGIFYKTNLNIGQSQRTYFDDRDKKPKSFRNKSKMH